MAINYAYNFAEIDPETRMCIQVLTSTSSQNDDPTRFIPIPVYDEEYLFKYYIDGNWYEDAEGTIPWTSSLI